MSATSEPTAPATVASWLAAARSGFCDGTETDDAGDCDGGLGGSWRVSKTAPRGSNDWWPDAVERCLELCSRCARCRYITLSRQFSDCSWYVTCERMQRSGADHRTAAVKFGGTALPSVRLRRSAAAFAATDARPLWLALGLLARPSALAEPPHAPWLTTATAHTIMVWRFVTTDASRRDDPKRFVVVSRCLNETQQRGGKGPACFCMTARWFRRAAALFPNAKFLGKVEDDASVHMPRLLHELRWAAATLPAMRADAALAHGAAPSALVWLGHFQWAVHDGVRGAYCGAGDDRLLADEPPTAQWCRPLWPPNNTLIAPFATGALDVRSHALAERLSACDLLWEHVEHLGERRVEHGAERRFEHLGEQITSCDGGMGLFVGLCVREIASDCV